MKYFFSYFPQKTGFEIRMKFYDLFSGKNYKKKIIILSSAELARGVVSLKRGFDISCKLSVMETICMKSQILFSGENKQNIVNLSSAELAQRLIKIKV